MIVANSVWINDIFLMKPCDVCGGQWQEDTVDVFLEVVLVTAPSV